MGEVELLKKLLIQIVKCIVGIKSVSCQVKNIIAVDLNRQLELRNVLEAPIKKITFHFLHYGENANREEESRKAASKQSSLKIAGMMFPWKI